MSILNKTKYYTNMAQMWQISKTAKTQNTLERLNKNVRSK